MSRRRAKRLERIGNWLALVLVLGAVGSAAFVYWRWEYREQRFDRSHRGNRAAVRRGQVPGESRDPTGKQIRSLRVWQPRGNRAHAGDGRRGPTVGAGGQAARLRAKPAVGPAREHRGGNVVSGAGAESVAGQGDWTTASRSRWRNTTQATPTSCAGSRTRSKPPPMSSSRRSRIPPCAIMLRM